jgi:phosphatidylinositol alpha-1,6-mannosyltransferase
MGNKTKGRRLLITLGFPPAVGGMQRYLYQRCLAFERGQITVLAPEMNGWREFDAQQPFPIHRWSGFLEQVPVIKRFLQLALPFYHTLTLYHQQAFDWLECGQALPFGLIALFFQKTFSVPYLIWAYGNDILKPQRYPFLKGLLHVILSNADALVAVSQSTKRKIVQLGLDPERITVIHPSVDTRRFHPQNDSSAVMARHHLQGKRVILTIARLVERKGIDVVIGAMPRIIEAIPDVVYLVGGTGPYQVKLEGLVEELELEGRVIFAGYVSDEELPCYYCACDVFVLVSRTLEAKGEMEGFGIVYLEAGACGKPVIAGRGGGASDAVQDGVTGLLVNPSDVVKVADAIVRVLEDEELARRLGENGRKKAMQQPDWALLEQEPAFSKVSKPA